MYEDSFHFKNILLDNLPNQIYLSSIQQNNRPLTLWWTYKNISKIWARTKKISLRQWAIYFINLNLLSLWAAFNNNDNLISQVKCKFIILINIIPPRDKFFPTKHFQKKMKKRYYLKIISYVDISFITSNQSHLNDFFFLIETLKFLQIY